MPSASLAFRFDVDDHTYTALDTGEELPHITGMLVRTGWVDDTWFTQEGSERGTYIHQLTASYDLGALELASVSSQFKGWVLAHAHATRAVQANWRHVEVPLVHPHYRFGGRPDRVGTALGLAAVLQIKSGAPCRADRIQTALEAILAASEGGLPAEAYARFGEYVKPNGKVKLERFKDRRDFDEAYDVIRRCCR